MATSTKTEPSEAGKAFLSGGLNEYLAYMRAQEAAKPVVEESKAAPAAPAASAPAASAPAAAAQSWTQQQLADAGNFIAKNIDDPGAIEAARASVEKATGMNISPTDLLKAAQSAQKPPELSRAMADVLSGDVYGNMTARQAYNWITQGIIDQPQMSAQSAQNIMRNLGISNRDIAQAALLDPRISAGAQYALTSTPLYQSGQQSGLAALNENLRNFINASLQTQTPTQAQASLQALLQSGSLTGGRALNEYDVERATGKTLGQLFGAQVLPPVKQLPPLVEPYVPLTAPAPEAAPPALSPGASGLGPSTAIVGKVPVSEQVKIPQLDTTFRASESRTPVYDRLGRVTGYEYTPAAKLVPATGTTVFNFVPPAVTNRPRQLLNVRDVPGATVDPVTGQTRMPLSASQQFARDRAQLDREFRQMYAQRAATDSSIPAQAPAAAAQAFRESAMSDPAFSAQLRLRELEQQRFEPTKADMALRAQYGAAPYQAALSNMFLPFITRNLPTLQSLVKTKVPLYSEKYPDIAAAYAKLSAEDKEKFPTIADYEQFHYQTYGQKEGRESPSIGRGALTSPYTTRFLKDGGAVSTEDFIAKKSDGGDVSRETLPPKLPPGVQRAVDKAQGSRTVLPVPGAGEARQFLSGFVGASPDYSVIDPNYKALGKSYRAGEQASVASEVFGAMTPFATASALAKTRQIPSVSQLIAYHGTPKSEIFRAFDPKYIKTGEGNTQYGYGFYFAENPQVSGTYKRMESEYKRMTGGLDPKTERAYDFMAQGLSEPEILSRLNYYYGSELSFDDAMKAVNQAKQHFNVGRLYKVDIDDAKIAKMLDWDAPLGEQSTVIQNLAKQYKLAPDDLGGDLVHAMKAKTPEGAKLMSEAGVPGIKYLDQGSRGLPQIKKQFLEELDPDASTEEVMDLLGKKVFSEKNEALLRELNNNDWLGFDYPSQAISEVFRAGFFRTNPDITEGLKKAVSAARQPDKGTRNIVVFPGEESSIKMLEVDGAPIEKKHGGEVSTKDFIAKFAQGSPNPDEVPSVIDEREEIRSESQRMLNRLKAQGPRSTGFGNLPPGVAALKRDIEQRQIDAAKPGSAATMPLIDRPSMRIASDIVRGATGTTPVEPTNPSEANRLMQALTGAYLPTAPVVRMGQSAKAAVQQPRATVASAKRGVEELGDTAAAQLARLSEPNALGSQAGILRAPGGYFPTSKTPTAMIPGRSISNLDEAFDPVLQEVKKIRDPEARQALTTLFNQKAKDFFTKQAGSIDDPLREAILSGEIKFPEGSPKNMGDRFATRLQEGVAAGELQSLRILNKEYDDMIGIKSVVPRRAGAPEVQDVVRSQIMAHIRDNLDKIPDAQLLAYADKKPVPRSKAMLAYAELTPQEKARYSGIQSYRVAKAAEEVRQKLKENPTLFSIILEPRIARTVFEQSKNVSDIDMARFPKISGGPSVENLVSPGMQTPEFGGVVPPGYFLPELETAINKGQPIFDLSSTNASFLRLLGMSPEELLRQARQIPVKELNKTSFPDFVKKAYANFQQLSQYEASLPKIKKNIEAGKAPPSDAMLYGVENFLPTNDGFRWVKVVKPDAVKAIASGMNNSVGSYATSTTYGSLSKGRSALENGEVEIYSLYDKNNVPHMTVEYLTQKASHSDPKLKTSDLKNSIMQFTGNGPLTGNKLPSEEYRAQVIDLVKKLNPQRVPTHIQKMVNSL